MNSEQLEKYSSAMTLSDMEIFVFPELVYSLVLANIMSPVIWKWREEECFKKLEDKSSYKKLMRLRLFLKSTAPRPSSKSVMGSFLLWKIAQGMSLSILRTRYSPLLKNA